MHSVPSMRRILILLLMSASLANGCGATTGDGDPAPVPTDVIGRVIVTTALENGQIYDRFDVNLQPFTPSAVPCPGARRTVGQCCYYGPTPPSPTQIAGSGTPTREANAGEIVLVDESSHTTLGTYDPTPGAYGALPANFTMAPWRVGDQLTVRAAGADFDAFSVSAPVLAPPVTNVMEPIARTHDLQVAWQHDPHGETVSIVILAGGVGAEVACVVPEAQGSVTVDASLLAELTSPGTCQLTAYREADVYTQTSAGRVEFSTLGWASNRCTLE